MKRIQKLDARKDARSIALAYQEAFSARDLDGLRKLFDPDIEFKGPGFAIHGSEALVEAIARLAPMLLRTEVKRVLTERDEAFVRYDFVTPTSVGPVSSVELLKIENGRIRSIWLLFDTVAWQAAVEETSRRAGTAAPASSKG